MLIMKNEAKTLVDIKDEVSCPLNAMQIEDGEIICTCPLTNFRQINRVSLGSIKSEILANCKECKLKLQVQKQDNEYNELIKLLKIDESNEVTCPADEKNVSPEETCATCSFFNRDKVEELMNKDGEKEIEFIPCNYPNLTKENKRLFLTRKQKLENKKKSAKALSPKKQPSIKLEEDPFDEADEDEENEDE